MKNQILIDSDPFFISQRIKEIDPAYFFVYNLRENRLELHNSSQAHSTFALSVPFDELDERMIDYARKTRKENIEKVVRELDAENQKLEKDLRKQAVEQIKEVFL